MRIAWGLAWLVLLAACGGPFRPGPASEPDRLAIAEAESAGLAAAGPRLRLGLGRRNATAVLLQEQGERRLWRAPGGVVLATDGGRVVATAGLPVIITGTRFDGPDPLDTPAALLEAPAEARRLVDLSGAARDPASMRFGIAFDCRLAATRTATPGLLVVEERCRTGGEGEVRNRFWAEEATGRVVQAEQWVGGGLGPMRLLFED